MMPYFSLDVVKGKVHVTESLDVAVPMNHKGQLYFSLDVAKGKVHVTESG